MFYVKFQTALKHSHPALTTALAMIPFFTLPLRKLVLSMVQVQMSYGYISLCCLSSLLIFFQNLVSSIPARVLQKDPEKRHFPSP